jgi:hypothetical protein
LPQSSTTAAPPAPNPSGSSSASTSTIPSARPRPQSRQGKAQLGVFFSATGTMAAVPGHCGWSPSASSLPPPSQATRPPSPHGARARLVSRHRGLLWPAAVR